MFIKSIKTSEDVLRLYKEEELPEFVEISLTDINQVGNFGNTPLHVASVRGLLDEVNALLEAGANVQAEGELGNSPLHDAAGQGHLSAVIRLLESGASATARNWDGNTAKDVALLMGHTDVVSAIEQWEPRAP